MLPSGKKNVHLAVSDLQLLLHSVLHKDNFAFVFSTEKLDLFSLDVTVKEHGQDDLRSLNHTPVECISNNGAEEFKLLFLIRVPVYVPSSMPSTEHLLYFEGQELSHQALLFFIMSD